MWEQLIVEDAHGRITGRIGHHHQQLKTNFNNIADETNLKVQQFAPVIIENRSKSRSGIDNRHTIVKHKFRKQDHLNIQDKHVLSPVSDHPKTDHFAKHHPSIELMQQPNYTFLDFLNSAYPLSTGSLSAHSQCSSLGSSVDSRPGSCGDSQPGSSDESTANQNSPRHRLNNSSPDNFGRFRIFEEYSASAPKMSPDRNNERQMNYEIHEDFNMNCIKINVTDVDNFARQSYAHNLEIHSPNTQADVSNNISPATAKTKETDNVCRQQSLVCKQAACISSGRWDLASVSSITNESGTEEHQSPDANTSQPIPLHPDKTHFCPRLLYCQTCSKYICENCAALCVYRHVTVDHMEFLDTVQQQVEDMLNEGYLGIDVLTDDIKDVMDALRFLHIKDQKSVAFYEEHFYPHVLYERYKNLKDDQGRLKDALRDLERIIHIAHPQPNKLLKLKDRVLAEIWRIRQNRKTKLRSGRENILFKNYRWLQSSYFPHEVTDNIRLKYPIPRGRPITGYDHNINLSNRIDNQVHSTDVQIIGHFGEGHSQNLCRPWGVTVDAEGNIIVSDRSNNRIQIFRRNGRLIRSFGTYGNGQCEFNKPAGIAVDARRRLVVADKDNHRIQIVTMEGVFLKEFGEYGDKEGYFNYPWDVAVNSTCEIAVTDTRNHRVQLFSAEGVFLRMFGGQPQNLRYLDSPRGVCFNKEGNLLVTDFNYHHVLKIDYDMEQARVLRCDNELRILRGDKEMLQNVESAPFQRPQGIISADDGNFLVADSRHNSIKAFNSLGHLMYMYNPGVEEINRPLGLALHTDGRVVFTDNGQNYVRLVKLTNHVNPIRRNTIMFG